MHKTWLNLTAAAEQQSIERLESWFHHQGALAVTVADAGDEPILEPDPGLTPVWSAVQVTGMFDGKACIDDLTAGLKAAGFKLMFTETLEDRLWEREWLSQFVPMQFGKRLWVLPSTWPASQGAEGDIQNLPSDAVIMRLDPGLAFGTGTHETTRLCLEYLEANLVPGQSVIDFGCGSGVLAVAAALLGGSPILGVDKEPQAITASRMNSKLNGVTLNLGLLDEISVSQAARYAGISAQGADLVIANILAQPLIDWSTVLSALVAPGGALVLSGIMESQTEAVSYAYESMTAGQEGCGLMLQGVTELGGWVRLDFHRAIPSADTGRGNDSATCIFTAKS